MLAMMPKGLRWHCCGCLRIHSRCLFKSKELNMVRHTDREVFRGITVKQRFP